jgi:hypothetical protein
MNNSLDGKRGTFNTKRPKSLGGFSDEDEETPDTNSLGMSKA